MRMLCSDAEEAEISQFELGFTTKLRLKSEAVPTLGLPRARKELPTLLPSHGDSGRHSEISKFLRAFNIQGLSEQTFYKHQAKLLIPTVSWQWKLEQDEKIREAATGGPLTLGGDMRADSPGHSAKYGSYTMMNLQSNSVIDIQLIQSSEVGNSVRMEKEGFIRSLTMLEEKGVKVQAIVTDRL
uniref:Transposase n=1 Tax=Knipowitschia caucasica TaxID=637954 RepID=A0AAV2K348_KNICA